MELTEAQREEYATLVHAVEDMPLCEPMAFTPGDPEFTLGFSEDHRSGHLPATWGAESGANDPCAAERRLAWWIAHTFLAR